MKNSAKYDNILKLEKVRSAYKDNYSMCLVTAFGSIVGDIVRDYENGVDNLLECERTEDLFGLYSGLKDTDESVPVIFYGKCSDFQRSSQ